jgi:uncharacterized caspase-like protein
MRTAGPAVLLASLATMAASGLEAQELSGPDFLETAGERYAVVIGVSDYQDDEIGDLSFAHRDAQAFAEFLTSPRAGLGGFRWDNVRLLTNASATSTAIRTALFDFLQRPGPDDLVVFFFAGHGMPAPGRPNATQYLIPSDGDRTNFPGSAIRMGEVESAVLQTKAKVVLFVDACHSGAIGSGVATRGNELNRINSVFLDRITGSRAGGVSMIVAATEGELAQEDVRWGGGHGVFTYHLLEGLYGRGDRNGDQVVDLGELFQYTRTRVLQDTDNQQTPFANDGLDRGLPMAVVAEEAELRRSVPVDSSSDGQDLDIFGTMDLLEKEWFVPDSLVTFLGLADTLEVRMGSPTGAPAPPTRLRWGSSNPDVARVDKYGVLEPRGPGVTQVTASSYTRDRSVLVRVLPPPRSIVITPVETEIELSQFDQIRFAATAELATGEAVAGMLPALSLPDTSVLAPDGGGRFRAKRQGSATVMASIGDVEKSYTILVRPPRLGIARTDYGAMRLADTIPLRASFVRRDGSVITDATGVTWESSDTSVLKATTSGLVAVDVGRAEIRAAASSAADSLEVFVLGDLLITSRVDGRNRISTLDIGTGRVEVIRDDESDVQRAALSPDGRHVVFSAKVESNLPRIHVMDADGTNLRRLTPERSGILWLPIPFYQEHSPTWSADGSRVFFVANYSGNYEVYSIAADGSDLDRITESGNQESGVSVASTGGRIAFERVTGANRSSIWLSLPDGAEQFEFTRGVGLEGDPVLLRGGKMLAVETTTNYRAGEGLALFDLVTGGKVGTIVRPRPDNGIVFAASPTGEYVAYSYVPRIGRADPVVVIIDLEGMVMDTFSLDRDEQLLHLAWGAIAPDSEGSTGGER